MTTDILKECESILRQEDISDYERDLFIKSYEYFLGRKSNLPKWEELNPIPIEDIPGIKSLKEPNEKDSKALLNSLVICKLNGGLGTSMGCMGPKSAIEVREGKTFLDLIVEQIACLNQTYGCRIPLLLMNSFYTHGDTSKIIRKYGSIEATGFLQNTFHRINTSTGLPTTIEELGMRAKCPPGHGDFYSCKELLENLKRFLGAGKKFLFVSNSDNLNATVSLPLLKYLADSKIPMLLEVTGKTKMDIKGGSLVRGRDGKLHLLEMAQVSHRHLKKFQDIRIFSNFNTNNLWFDIASLIRFMESDFRLPPISNKKSVEQRQVIQLETAIASAVSEMEGAQIIQVDRKRFLPVKKTDDLFLIRSNIFSLEKGSLRIAPERKGEALPFIHLGEKFQKIEDYQKRIPDPPDILELDHLTLVGDVFFGEDISLKGHVVLVCQDGSLHLPNSSSFLNQMVSGKLTLSDF